MALSTIKLLLVLLLTLTLALAHDFPHDFLAAHNAARARVGVGPIRWDKRVAAYARNSAIRWARDCRPVHSGGPYGENIARSHGYLSGTAAVNMWVAEKQYYNHRFNSCAHGKFCGHYTQVVWRSSVRLGCAKARCRTGGTIVVCYYHPRGNIRGQRPY